MQLEAPRELNSTAIVQQMKQLDKRSFYQLRRLGIEPGCRITVVRQYPFHGPVIIEFDHQQLGIRDAVFETLIGG